LKLELHRELLKKHQTEKSEQRFSLSVLKNCLGPSMKLSVDDALQVELLVLQQLLNLS